MNTFGSAQALAATGRLLLTGDLFGVVTTIPLGILLSALSPGGLTKIYLKGLRRGLQNQGIVEWSEARTNQVLGDLMDRSQVTVTTLQFGEINSRVSAVLVEDGVVSDSQELTKVFNVAMQGVVEKIKGDEKLFKEISLYTFQHLNSLSIQQEQKIRNIDSKLFYSQREQLVLRKKIAELETSLSQLGLSNLNDAKRIASYIAAVEQFGRKIRLPQQLPPAVQVLGRDDLLERVQNVIRTTGRVQLHGMPGVGKTTLARLAAYTMQKDYALGVVRVDARELPLDSNLSLSARLRLLAASISEQFLTLQKAEGDVVGFVRDLLALPGILLVVDNLEDMGLLEKFTDEVSPINLIVTSRNQSPISSLEAVEVGVLSPEAAEEQYRLVSESGLGFESEVEQICELLGYLPLAVRLVAIDAKRLKQNPDLTLKRLEEASNIIREVKAYDGSDAEHSIYLAFRLSYDSLGDEEKLAFQSFGFLNPTGARIDNVLILLKPQLEKITRISIQTIIDELSARSLVDALQDTSSKFYNMHSLLREFAVLLANDENKVTDFVRAQVALVDAAKDVIAKKGSQYDKEQLEFFEKHYKQLLWFFMNFHQRNDISDFQYALGLNWFLHQTYKIEESTPFTEFLLSKAQSQNEPKVSARLLKDLGVDAGLQGNIVQAIHYVEQAREIFEDIEDFDWMGWVYLFLLQRYSETGDEEKKQKYADRSFSFMWSSAGKAKLTAEFEELFKGYPGLTRLMGQLEEDNIRTQEEMEARGVTGEIPKDLLHLTAIPMARLNLKLALHTKPKDIEMIAHGHQSLGDSYLENGDFKPALKNFKDALRYAKALGNLGYQIDSLLKISESQFRLGSKHKAFEAVEEAVQISDCSRNLLSKVKTRYVLGRLFASLGQFDEAKKWFTETLHLGLELFNANSAYEAIMALGNVYHDEQKYIEVPFAHHLWALANYEKAEQSFGYVKAGLQASEEFVKTIINHIHLENWDLDKELNYLSLFYKGVDAEFTNILIETAKESSTFEKFRAAWGQRKPQRYAQV